MSSETILFDVQDSIATITLNRPEKLNALTMPMMLRLEELVTQIEADKDIRVVIITGAGERAFSAGADINEWSGLEPLDLWRSWVKIGHRVYERLARLRQPMIAALNGYTFGGGLELALTADIRLAAEHVQVALPEVSIGIIPGWTGTQRLPPLIGVARAKQMIFTGERISAQKAESWGLVNEVMPGRELLSGAQELAQQIAKNAPISVQLTKQVIDGGLGQATGSTLEMLATTLTATTEDGKEGSASFKERRPPVYKGN